jgi:O-methyltransferase
MLKTRLKKLIRLTGYDLVRYRPYKQDRVIPPDVSDQDETILRAVAPYSMTSVERLLALIQAVRHIVRSEVPGALVECGVWKGGSMMAMAHTLIGEGDTSRNLYLYDTFEGMSEPTDADRGPDETPAVVRLNRSEKGTGVWCYAGIEEVQANMAATGYPGDRVRFVKGKIEDVIPSQSPVAPIALLRLDTDWYESTRHELLHLFPLVHEGGVVILDDYGHWQGARRATDEFLAAQTKSYYLHRIDYTGRLLIK